MILRSPANSSCDSRGRVTMDAPGSNRSMIGRMVAAPDNVSSRSAPVEDAVGEDMAAFEIGCDLDFIDREKRHVEILCGIASTVETQQPRVLRLSSFPRRSSPARPLRADARNDLVVDLAREQPQRQADHAGEFADHPLDREMALAGIGRSRTAVTPAPGARSWANAEGDDEKAIFYWVSAPLLFRMCITMRRLLVAA